MRRALLVQARDKGRSLVRRTCLLDHVKDDKTIKEDEILPWAESQDQVRGLIRGSNFNLAGKEEFDRLRESMAEVKSMFMETEKEILGLKQILNAQHVDYEDDHISSDHVNHILPHEHGSSDSGDESFSVTEEHSQEQDEDHLQEDMFQGMIDESEDEEKLILMSEVKTPALEQVQRLKVENEEAVSRLCEMECKFFKAMDEIEKLKLAATHYDHNRVQSLKSSFEEDKAWVEKNLEKLEAQIKVFEVEVDTYFPSLFCKSILISKVLPAFIQEQVQILRMENEKAKSMICEIESKFLKAMEEIDGLKAAPLADEVENLLVNVARLKLNIHETLEERDNWMKNSLGIGEYRRKILLYRSGVCEQENKIFKALEESEKLGAVALKTEINLHLLSCQGMLKRMKERLDQELWMVDLEVKTIYRRRN